MNPGPLEEAGKAANSFLDAMKAQPVMLGLVVMNLAMVFMLYFALTSSLRMRKTEFDLIFKSQSEVAQLLARCVIPTKDGGDG